MTGATYWISVTSCSNCVRSQNKVSILEGTALFSSTDTKITLERLFCEFFSVKNQIKKVLYGMSPKMTIFAQNVNHGGPQIGSDYQKTIHGNPARWSTVCSFGTPDVDRVCFSVRSPLTMILGALERGDAQLSSGFYQVENF